MGSIELKETEIFRKKGKNTNETVTCLQLVPINRPNKELVRISAKPNHTFEIELLTTHSQKDEKPKTNTHSLATITLQPQ